MITVEKWTKLAKVVKYDRRIDWDLQSFPEIFPIVYL